MPLFLCIGDTYTLCIQSHDQYLDTEPTAEQVSQIEFMPREQAAEIVDLSKLPEDVSETLRIVRIGDYDACACIGAHVNNTSEIGTFKIISHSYADGVWRLRWKVVQDKI